MTNTMPQSSKKWQTPKKSRVDQDHSRDNRNSIEVGDEGIWATCDRGREGRCVGELRDLLQQVRANTFFFVLKFNPVA